MRRTLGALLAVTLIVLACFALSMIVRTPSAAARPYLSYREANRIALVWARHDYPGHHYRVVGDWRKRRNAIRVYVKVSGRGGARVVLVVKVHPGVYSFITK